MLTRSMLGVALGAAFVSTVAAAGQQASACAGSHQTAKVKPITVEQLASALQANKNGVAVFDANGAETRAKFGVIPGARLLSHYASYEPQKELPADKQQVLVFYCAGSKCTAAPQAAEKAAMAGYTNVYVLEVGIRGWTEAGKATTGSDVAT